MQEYHVYGSPGTGKTTYLASKTIPDAVEKYGPEKVVVSSFTRSAAWELANRQDDVEPRNVGTLHALCYRELNQPTIAETKVKEWNDNYPAYKMSADKGKSGLDAEGGIEGGVNTSNFGDEMLSEYNLKRGQLIPRDKWPSHLKTFVNRWEGWKAENGYYDFTDLIDYTLRNRPYPPNNARVIIVDEAQDLTPLQFKLVRSWGEQADYLVLAGDDDQTIFTYAGASPDALLGADIPAEQKIILKQSHRLPRRIHKKATTQLKHIKKRQHKDYRPRDSEGRVVGRDDNYKHPDFMVPEAIYHAMREDKTVMILASCSYRLKPTIALLKKFGAPFHNPYRPEQRQWNPLYKSRDSCTGIDIIANFFDHGIDESYWNIPQFVKWISGLKEDVLVDGGKKGIKQLKQAIADDVAGLHTCRNAIESILSADAIEPALNRDIRWLRKNLKPKHRNSIEYPYEVYTRYGLKAVTGTPNITVGTIHSSKGGEASVVYLFPDISRSAYEDQLFSIEGRDALSRLFYVGITRASEKLITLEPVLRRGKPYFYDI